MSNISDWPSLSSKTNPFSDQRRYIRCLNERGKKIKLLLKRPAESLLTQSEAIILDESFGGLGLIITTTEEVHLHQLCYVETPGIGWIKAKVAWTIILSDSLMKRVGIYYLKD